MVTWNISGCWWFGLASDIAAWCLLKIGDNPDRARARDPRERGPKVNG